jgi:hypothetical protein
VGAGRRPSRWESSTRSCTIGDPTFSPLGAPLVRVGLQAEEENGQSGIYLGIHWAFDKTASIQQGRDVANYVFQNAFQPQ